MKARSHWTRRKWIQVTSAGAIAGSPQTSIPPLLAEESASNTGQVSLADLDELFHNPPLARRPSCYWVWLNHYTDREQLTRELREFKAKGLSGAYIFEIGARDPEGIVRIARTGACHQRLSDDAHLRVLDVL